MDSALTPAHLDKMAAEFTAHRSYKAAQNALARTPFKDVALDHQLAVSIQHNVSHHLDDWKVTNQKRSGRCWMFAGLNLLRPAAMKAMNLKDFEFSQNHTLFYDKLERANYLLEQVIDLAGVPLDDRTFAQVVKAAAEDGGQWNMFVALLNKHGVVPQSVMPETHSSSHTAEMNEILRMLLRGATRQIRDAAADGADQTALRQIKADTLTVVHRTLCMHLGTPPSAFDWQWKDKDGEFHRDGTLTPQEFAARYITLPVDEYVCLVHDPRHPYGQTYTVDRLGNMVDGPAVVYLNVDIDVIRQAAADTIVGGEPVWFGCDVGQQMHRDLGVWDANLFDVESLYDTAVDMDKANRLHYQQTAMTHAMLFTGVDLLDGLPRRWRVENSWGSEGGVEGYYTMTDSWFGEYVFEIAAHRSKLSAEVLAGLDTTPVVLPAWDPMGSLAR